MQKPRRKGLKANAAWLFVERFFRVFAAFVVGIAVARYLGPEKFGFLAFGLNVSAILSALAALGLDSFIIRRLVAISSDKEAANLLTTSFCMKLMAAIIVSLGSSIVVMLSPVGEADQKLLFLYFVFIVFSAFDVVDFYFQSEVKSKLIALTKTFALIITSIVKILLIFIGADLVWFVSVVGLEALLVAGGYIWLALNRIRIDVVGVFDFNLAKQLIVESWPMLLSSLAVCGYMKLDAIMLKFLMGDLDVGIYVAATRLVSSMFIISIVISNTVFPMLVSIGRQSERFDEISSGLFNLLGIVGFLMAGFFTLAAEPITWILYGEAFEGSGEVLAVVAWVIPFVFFNNLAWKYHVVDGTQKLGMYRVFFGLLLNIALNLLLIPEFGLLGAAVGTLLARLTSVLILSWLYKESRYIAKLMVIGMLSVLNPPVYVRCWRLVFREKY